MNENFFIVKNAHPYKCNFTIHTTLNPLTHSYILGDRVSKAKAPTFYQANPKKPPLWCKQINSDFINQRAQKMAIDHSRQCAPLNSQLDEMLRIQTFTMMIQINARSDFTSNISVQVSFYLNIYEIFLIELNRLQMCGTVVVKCI